MDETTRTDLPSPYDPISTRRTSVEDIWGYPADTSAPDDTDPLWDSYAAVPAPVNEDEADRAAQRSPSDLHEWYPPAWLSPEDVEAQPPQEVAPPIREELFEDLEPVAVPFDWTAPAASPTVDEPAGVAEEEPDPEPSADLEPEEAPGRYEISDLGTGRLEALFAEGEDLREVPSAAVIAEERPEVDLAETLDIPDRWMFSGKRSHGLSTAGGAGKRTQPAMVEPSPEPESPAPRMDGPAPFMETPALRMDAPAPHPTRRREVGKHRKRRQRGHRARTSVPTSEVGQVDALQLPAGRLRGGLVGSAVRVLGVALPLAAATLAYLSYVR